MRNTKVIVALVAFVLLVAACGGKSAEEELLEQILESGGEDIGSVGIDTDSDGNVSINVEGDDGEDVSISASDDGDDVNITVEGEDGEEVTITGDDDEFTITVEGDDGGSMTFGGGEVPEDMTLPVPDGGEVVTSMSMEDGAMVTLTFPIAAYGQLVAFYESELPSGDDVYKTESTYTDDDGTHRSTTWMGDTFLVSIDDCFGMESTSLDSVCVTLNEFGS
ncbi:MAG: hypothetical protein QNJ81_03140 [Acidimicrobiia bacterium]|nr:hypothetical protein [Acidimicrobiia bacterium]